MATGLSRSLEGGHDMIYDYCCTTCARQNLNAEALFYCKDCSKLFCEECKNHHAKFLERHRVLGRKEVAKWGDVKPVTASLMCDEHPGKELEMYCEDHDRVCCHTCISVKHRICKEVKPVSEVSKKIQKKSEFRSFIFEACMTHSRLKSLYDIQENNISMLQKARGEITATFKNMRQKLNQIVDRLEKESTKVLDTLLSKLKAQVKIDKNVCSDFFGKIQKLLNDIQTLGKQCDELVFQGYKKCSEHMASADNLLSSMQNVDFQIMFTPDSKTEQYLSSLNTLGSFSIMPTGPLDNFKYKDFAPLLTPPDDGYTVEKKQTYNVKTSEDENKCYISAICQLSNGQTAIVDFFNSKVKLLSTSTFSVLDTLKLPDNPQDICSTTGTDLSLTVCDYPDRHEIQFINAVNGKLSHTRTVQLHHECYGIAYHNAQLYVGSKNALYVYNQLGKKVKKIYEGKPNTYHPTVSRFCFSDDGSRIYATNTHHNLRLILDSSGQLLSTFSDPELLRPEGVCVADNVSVFVCGWRSKTVLKVNREGRRKVTTLATKNDGIYDPRSLCYDRKTHTLLVGQGYNNLLLALKFK